MGLFDNIDKAEVYDSSGNYLLPGAYTLRIKECLAKETRNKGEAYIVEFEVLESDNEGIKVGSTRSWYQGMSNKDVALPACLEFCAAVAGIDPKDKEAVHSQVRPQAAALLSESLEGGFKDQIVRVECYMKQTKAGKDFTVHNWAPAA